MTKQLNRWDFTKHAAVAASTWVLPRFAIGKPGQGANSRLNMAFFSIGG